MGRFWTGMYGIDSLTAHIAAGDAKSKASEAKTSVDELSARLDRTVMACEALWTFVHEKLGVSEQEFIDRVNEIDLSDGQLDGKVRRTPSTCSSCGRKVASRFPKCMYCGEKITNKPFA